MPRRIAIFTAAVAVVAILGLALWKRISRTPAAPAATTSQARQGENPPSPRIRGAVLVNARQISRAHGELPLLIEVAVRNPFDEPIRVRDASALVLDVTRNGQSVNVTVEPIGEQPDEIDSRGAAAFSRTIVRGLAAGTYQIAARCARDAFGSSPCGSFSPAVIEIVEGSADAEERAYVEVQVLSRRGDVAAALALIDRTVQQDPDALLWRLWRADALREQGRAAEASAEYAGLAAESIRRQRASGVENPEIPFWLAQAMGR